MHNKPQHTNYTSKPHLRYRIIYGITTHFAKRVHIFCRTTYLCVIYVNDKINVNQFCLLCLSPLYTNLD